MLSKTGAVWELTYYLYNGRHLKIYLFEKRREMGYNYLEYDRERWEGFVMTAMVLNNGPTRRRRRKRILSGANLVEKKNIAIIKIVVLRLFEILMHLIVSVNK